MKQLKLISNIFLLLMVSQLNQYSYAKDVVQINVVGSIVATTCNVITPSQTINLGSWQAQSTSGVGSGIGSKSAMVEYTLDFDCPAGLGVNIQLEGNQQSPTNMYNIGLEDSPQSAKGIAIEIHAYRNQWLSIVYGDNRTLIAKTVDGINSIRLRSFYLQTAETITPGTANSSVTLVITYQ